MKLLIVAILTTLFYGLAYADSAPKKDDPKVVISPVPGVKADPKGLELKKHVVYCKKTKGEEKLCVPAHKANCLCANE